MLGFIPYGLLCLVILLLILYTNKYKNITCKIIRIILKILLLILSIFIFLWVSVFSLLAYGDTQRYNADEYLTKNDGFNALKSYKRYLYIQSGQIDGCGWYYPVSEIYAFGLGGVPQNDDNALYWYKRYEGFYLTSFMPVDDGCGFDTWYLFAISKCYAGVDCRSLYMRDQLHNIKLNSKETIIWLNHAADYGVKKAKNIQQKCQTKNVILKNESVIFDCVRNEMLELQNSK